MGAARIRYLCNSFTASHVSKEVADLEEYREKVSLPMMSAIDKLPAEWKQLVNEFGYVDVYRAYLKGIPAVAVRQRAAQNGGLFVL